ncbi:MAG: Glycosyltransferase [Candidatus Nomurabacteria bacterium GW2011_GWB1_40_7]|uniref:Glycosyltransferase n=1 Tax=Candidatus Nomurabacteria bacterium GW2011_GWB1_40_7 TaxID=1618744 RepID=A0A0G0SXZ3_9BACT|nr:MAG: Glycosyltransferase [Candidatus Nomurabacteria bacterium GW2011_GWB1_40_7]
MPHKSKINDQKTLSIVIPVFNEKNTISELLNLIDAVELPDIKKELIIIDDCSTDGTREILKNIEHKHMIIFKEKNEGKGAAVKEGFMKAAGDFIIIQDADLEYSPSEYVNMIKPLIDKKCDVVYGSRFLSGKPHRALYFHHYIGNRCLTILSNIFTNLNLSDMETCYKAFNRPALDKIKNKLTASRFGIEPEITALVAKNNLRIYEVGISYFGRTYQEGKKIGWKDGVAAIWYILKSNLS